MFKRFISFLLSISILFFSVSLRYAHANVAVCAINSSLGGVSTISGTKTAATALYEANPYVAATGSFIVFNMYVTKAGRDKAISDYNTNPQLQQTYSSAEQLYECNTDAYNMIGLNSCDSFVDKVEGFRTLTNKTQDKIINTSKKMYAQALDVSQGIKEEFGQVTDGIITSFTDTATGVTNSIDGYLEKLKNTKIRLQTDLDFLNSTIDLDNIIGKDAYDKIYGLTGSLSDSQVTQENLSKLGYKSLYNTFNSMNLKQNILYEVSKKCLKIGVTDFPIKCVVFNPAYKDINRESNKNLYWACLKVGDVPISSFDFNHIYLISSVAPMSSFLNSEELNDYADSPYLNDIFYRCERWFCYYSSNKVKYSSVRCIGVPQSLASTLEFPFSNVDELKEYIKRYEMSTIYTPENRPISYTMSLNGVMTGTLDDLKPLTKDMTVDLPVVNATDFPIDDVLFPLPDAGSIDESLKDKDWTIAPDGAVVVPGTGTGVIPGTGSISLDWDGYFERLEEMIKSLVVPDDLYFKTKFNELRAIAGQKIDTEMLNSIDYNVGEYGFPDITGTINGQTVTFVNFSYLRQYLPNIKMITDPLCYLMLLLYIYNELYFLIRGVYPINSMFKGDS